MEEFNRVEALWGHDMIVNYTTCSKSDLGLNLFVHFNFIVDLLWFLLVTILPVFYVFVLYILQYLLFSKLFKSKTRLHIGQINLTKIN
jgi:hypothetical protein